MLNLHIFFIFQKYPNHFILFKILVIMLKNTIVFYLLIIISPPAIAGFPDYYELNINESIQLTDGTVLKIKDKSVSAFDSTLNRIASASVKIELNGKTHTLNVGYESDDLIADGYRIGIEFISDYEKVFRNKRIHLEKDVRIRVSDANELLTPKDSHVYPLFTPWNSGFRNQGWLCVCYNIKSLEGRQPVQPQRYHDGFDFGLWEGQLIRSVCSGIVVKPNDFPELMKTKKLYDKNHGHIGGNPLLIKHPELPLVYYYTHMSGLSKKYIAGDTIAKGEVIGYGSARGSSGGWYHLHLGMIHLEKKVFINPYPFIKEWYAQTMSHYNDFISCFDVYLPRKQDISGYDFERSVLESKRIPSHNFCNTVPGVIHVREAVAKHPFAGLNHVLFNQMAILKTTVESPEKKDGEVWFGHTGVARVYLNGNLIYAGENSSPYAAHNQPFQWDKTMKSCQFKKGKNQIIVFIRQTNPYWSFSLRVRDSLGRPL